MKFNMSDQHRRHFLAVFWIVLCKISFIGMMVIVKAQHTYPTLQLNFLRAIIVLVLVFPFLIRKGISGFKTFHISNQLYRLLFGVLAIIGLFYGYRVLEMAKVSALEYSYGLILPILAIIFLNEQVSFKRWLSLIWGYIGIWIIVNPTYDKIEAGEIVVLLSVLLKAASSLHLKKVTHKDPPLLSVFYSAVAMSFVLGFYFIIISHFPSVQGDFLSPWHELDFKSIKWILFMAVLSLVAQYSYIQAFRYGDLNFLSGFEYLKIIFATLFGILLFSEIPTWQTILGGLVILSSSYLITHQEIKKNCGK